MRPQFQSLLVLLLALGAVWGFLALASEVAEGDTSAWDERLLLSLREPGDPADPIGGGVVEEALRDVTALGGATWLIFLAAAATGALALAGQGRSSLLLLGAVAGGQVLSHLAKGVFDRPRPALVSHEAYVQTASFPSGHSMMAAVTYLTLAVMLSRATRRRALKAYFFALAVTLTLAVGVSRVYLGVHWPTDVLAGWMIGAAWAMICALTADLLARRGAVEPERDEGPGAAAPPGASRGA